MTRGIALIGVLAMAAAAAAVKPIDGGKSGEYVSGPWKYIYEIRAAGTRSEGRHGVLLFKGRLVEAVAGAKAYDRIQTPWGLMQFFGDQRRRFGGSGWLSRRTYGQPLELKKGRLLPPPKAEPLPPPKPLELTAADSGKPQRVALGQMIHVRLAGNMTTGYSWAVRRIEGEAVRQEGKVAYKAAGAAGAAPRVGGGGVFVATFQAVKLGRGHVWLGYRRPWEKDKEPIRTFEGIFDVVQPWEIGQDAQGVSGVVLKLTGNHMPGPDRPTRGTVRPLSVPVHIFKGELKPLATPDPRHPALVKTVRSDRQGRYRAALEPGVYTVVAEIGGKLYLNVLRSDGHWATVTVHPGRWTTWNIRHTTSDAAF